MNDNTNDPLMNIFLQLLQFDPLRAPTHSPAALEPPQNPEALHPRELFLGHPRGPSVQAPSAPIEDIGTVGDSLFRELLGFPSFSQGLPSFPSFEQLHNMDVAGFAAGDESRLQQHVHSRQTVVTQGSDGRRHSVTTITRSINGVATTETIESWDGPGTGEGQLPSPLPLNAPTREQCSTQPAQQPPTQPGDAIAFPPTLIDLPARVSNIGTAVVQRLQSLWPWR
eukprot:m.239931 g.239931  ORF g.239931 m.239931 type:complete len:225 (-) comp13573_c0_seq1:205-879(-)